MTYDLSAIYGSSKTDIVNTLLLAPTVRASRSVLTLWSDAECRFCRRQNDVVVWKTLYILQADKSPPCSLGEIRPREWPVAQRQKQSYWESKIILHPVEALDDLHRWCFPRVLHDPAGALHPLGLGWVPVSSLKSSYCMERSCVGQS